MMKKHSAAMVTKEIFLTSRRHPKTMLLRDQVFTSQRRLAMTALPGLAPARSTRASAANHRESISACRRDDFGVANVNVHHK
jgi:hypothetical protein